MNLAAKENGWADYGDYSRRATYETDRVEEMFDTVWEDLKELYFELHAYVRYKLKDTYGDLVKDDELIPAHLLGEAHALTWLSVLEKVKPYGEYMS